MPPIPCLRETIPYHSFALKRWDYVAKKDIDYVATVGFIVVPCDGMIDMTVSASGKRAEKPLGQTFAYLNFINGEMGWAKDEKDFDTYDLSSNITRGYSSGELVIVRSIRRNVWAHETGFRHSAVFEPNNPIAAPIPAPVAAEQIPVAHEHVAITGSIGQHRFTCSYLVKARGRLRLRARLVCEPSNERSLAKLRVFLNEVLIYHERDFGFGQANISYDVTIEMLAGVTANVRFELEYENSRPNVYEAIADWIG